MYRGANDNYETGYNNWPCKQDLYRVKFAVDEMLKKTSRFSGEEEWLLEQEQQKMWKVLKKLAKDQDLVRILSVKMNWLQNTIKFLARKNPSHAGFRHHSRKTCKARDLLKSNLVQQNFQTDVHNVCRYGCKVHLFLL